MLEELEHAFHVFLTGTGFGGVALATMSLCSQVMNFLSQIMFMAQKEISEKLLKEFDVKAKFSICEFLDDLKNKVTNKTKMILVENPGSNTFEFQDDPKLKFSKKEKNIYLP